MLHAVDYEAKHRRLHNLRHAGTGDWLFRQEKYVEWEGDGGSAFLSCRGIRKHHPGVQVGSKTNLLVSRLRKKYPHVRHLVNSISDTY